MVTSTLLNKPLNHTSLLTLAILINFNLGVLSC
jgi:hypothetical protein